MASLEPLQRGGRVLVVDDQAENLALVEEILTSEGFTVELTADGGSALEKARANPPDCVLLDIMMPGLDGFAVCRELRSRRSTHFIPVIMLTALSESEDRIRALSLGADDFLTKPVNVAEVVSRVRSLVRIKHLRDELDSSDSIIVSMVEALESSSPSAAGHSRRVSATASALARTLQLDATSIEVVTKGAILHDIGKIGLPLTSQHDRPGLTRDERNSFRSHPELGERILEPFRSFAPVRPIVRHHHERYDGSGFPDGLGGGDLNLESEIVAVANLIDDRLATGGRWGGVRESLSGDAAAGRFRRELVEAVARISPVEDRGSAAWHDMLPPPAPRTAGRVLIVGSDSAMLRSLTSTIAGAGCLVERVATSDEALDAECRRRPDLVVLDAQMSNGQADAICRALKSRPQTEYLPVLLVTGALPNAATDAAGTAADDVLVLPIGHAEIVARVRSLMRLRLYLDDLEERQAVIVALAFALEAKDPYTHGHSDRVGLLAARLGRRLGMSELECHVLRVAGLLHDIGKIGMPETLLNKRGRLDDDEMRQVRRHPSLGERICRPLRTMQPVLPLIRSHHERFDGSGYPDGLLGSQVPVGAQILGLADAFDALTSERSYRRDFSVSQAMKLLGREAVEGRWDTQLLDLLEREIASRRDDGER
jgi:putative two-component system response regulator